MSWQEIRLSKAFVAPIEYKKMENGFTGINFGVPREVNLDSLFINDYITRREPPDHKRIHIPEELKSQFPKGKFAFGIRFKNAQDNYYKSRWIYQCEISDCNYPRLTAINVYVDKYTDGIREIDIIKNSMNDEDYEHWFDKVQVPENF